MTSGSKPTGCSFHGPSQKGPSYDPAVKRLAVHVEDHPLDYRQFEGIIPGGNYGAGSVIVWDEGTYRNITVRGGAPVPVREAVEAGHVSVWLEGSKLIGGWSLTRFGPEDKSWTMVKRNDDRSDPGKDITAEQPRSVQSGRTIDDVMKEAAAAAGDPGRRALRGRGMPVASRGGGSGHRDREVLPAHAGSSRHRRRALAPTRRCLEGGRSGCSSQNWTVYAASRCAMGATWNCCRVTGSRSILVSPQS